MSGMVMTPVPSLDDLFWLFESEPTPESADWREYWPYAAVTFKVTRADCEVEFHIEPGYEVVRVRITRSGLELLDLDLRQVRTVEVEKIQGRELLRVLFPEDASLGTLFIRLKPEVFIGWRVGHHL